jgi:hypothetical protein
VLVFTGTKNSVYPHVDRNFRQPHLLINVRGASMNCAREKTAALSPRPSVLHRFATGLAAAGLLFVMGFSSAVDASAQEADGTTEPLPIDVGPNAYERQRIAEEAYNVGHDTLAANRADLALPYFQTACRYGNPKGCFNVGTLIAQQLERRPAGSAPDAVKVGFVTSAFDAACQLGFQRGCAMLVGYFRKPEFGMQDFGRAASLAASACAAAEYSACTELAEMHYIGEGMPANLAQAAELFRKSCDLGENGASCFNYAILLKTGEVVSSATSYEYYRRGCRAGSNEACINLAADYIDQKSEYKYLEIAAGLLMQSCNRGAMLACTNLASLVSEHGEELAPGSTAVALYRKACDGGEGSGCRGLGNLAQDGNRQAGSARDAIALFIKGCELGASRSCYNAGLTYWSGHKAPIRPDLALQWFAKGCDLKSASSCAGAALAKLSAKSEQRELAIAEASRWLDQARYLDPGNPLVQAIGDWLKDGGDPAAAPVIPSSSPALATGS